MQSIATFPLLLLFLILLFGPATPAVAGEPPPLLLAKPYTDDIDVRDYWVSEKLDGVRAYWDGRRLLSRRGNVFQAPAWFTEGFPPHPLDGELWLGRGAFEATVSAVRKQRPVAAEWRQLSYQVFELPGAAGDFSQRLARLERIVAAVNSPYLKLIPQQRLKDQAALQRKLDEVVAGGGEGLMLHRADSLYATGRGGALLKLKTYQDAEAVVIAHLPGKGRNLGRLGALLVEMPDGKQFKIGSGFSDQERENPPPIGALVSYKYYGLSRRGIPRFASFLRIRQPP